jgi:sulfide:quinone oxidoreductase
MFFASAVFESTSLLSSSLREPAPLRVLKEDPSSYTSGTAQSSTRGKYKVLIVGGGSGGLTVANQIYNRFKAAGTPLNSGDVAIVDAAEYHYYQPGWTLVGAGLMKKEATRKPLVSLIPPHISLVKDNVKTFTPDSNSVTTASGQTLNYDALVVATGLEIKWDAIKGLKPALEDPSSGVSSIYSYDKCDKVWNDIEGTKKGTALFTQPAGIIKCAGAPQKIMWMAWDQFRRTGRGNDINVSFYTGMPTMFSVPKYSDALNALRKERGVGGFFQHNLTEIDSANRKAIFTVTTPNPADAAKPTISKLSVDYTTLHVTPPMGPPPVISGSPLADAAGWVSVDPGTMRHTNKDWGNVWALGDCSSLPTSKTAAAITAEAPILTENLYTVMTKGELAGEKARYDGYTSCPLLTGYGELMLAEFKYGLVPKETFSSYVGDQSVSRKIFYHLKKDVFPVAYWTYMVKGKWFGTSAFSRPTF